MINVASIDLAGTLLAAVLTIMILSYLIGDNPLFRIATHIFVGVAAGYAGAVAWHYVLRPSLISPILAAFSSEGELTSFEKILQIIITLIPLLLSALLILKGSVSTSRFGTIPAAIMTGVGAAVVIGGALTGTLLPQIIDAFGNLSPGYVEPVTGEQGLERLVNTLILLIGAISTLLYFQFSIRRKDAVTGERTLIMQVVSKIGQIFIAITFGAIYAGSLIASVVVLSERLRFIVDVFFRFLFS